VTCPPDDGTVHFLPDPLNCSRYYICASGFPISQECPFPLVWDPTIDGCNSPGAYACQVTTTAPPATDPPTTAAPTTAAPTTAAPTTAAPTTAAPAPTTVPTTKKAPAPRTV